MPLSISLWVSLTRSTTSLFAANDHNHWAMWALKWHLVRNAWNKESYEHFSGVYVSVSKRDGAKTWGIGVISFISGGGNDLKYSLWPLGEVGPKRHIPKLYSFSIKHFTLQWCTRRWTHTKLHCGMGAFIRGGCCGCGVIWLCMCIWGVTAAVDVCAWEQCVCNCMCKQVCMIMWAITDGWCYFADFVIL